MPLSALASYLRWHHPDLAPLDLEPTETPGYWEIKNQCGGPLGGCRHPLHRTLFNDGSCYHTVSFFDPTRDTGTGRFTSPYATWREARRLAGEGA